MGRWGKVISEEGELLLDQVQEADTFWTRFRGLMGKKELRPSEGLLLKNTGSIHTCFMRFPIQVVYLDEKYRVLNTETVLPWRIGSIVKRTKHVLELSSGETPHFSVGERIRFEFGNSDMAGKE